MAKNIIDIDEIDLYSQNEELKGMIRANDLLLRDKDFRHAKIVENYEIELLRLKQTNDQMKEKYEKIYETQRKLEKLNSDLEDKLLRIVEKYENEQKSLLEELTLAHSKLVESKLSLEELERQKEAYRQDCNLAVNLLQTNSNEFISHSYSSLPVNLKQRLKSYLSPEEILKLEYDDEKEKEQQKQTPNSILKFPVFQPTVAAAMMFNIQNSSQQKQKLKSKIKNDINILNNSVSVTLFDETKDESQNSISNNNTDNDNNRGKVSSLLLAKILKKDNEEFSKKSYKLLPYICIRCKKDLHLCDTPVQTNSADLNEFGLKVIYPHKEKDPVINRSKSIGFGLSKLTPYHVNHQKCASTDLSYLNNEENRNRTDSWTI